MKTFVKVKYGIWNKYLLPSSIVAILGKDEGCMAVFGREGGGSISLACTPGELYRQLKPAGLLEIEGDYIDPLSVMAVIGVMAGSEIILFQGVSARTSKTSDEVMEILGLKEEEGEGANMTTKNEIDEAIEILCQIVKEGDPKEVRKMADRAAILLTAVKETGDFDDLDDDEDDEDEDEDEEEG